MTRRDRLQRLDLTGLSASEAADLIRQRLREREADALSLGPDINEVILGDIRK
jgi:hypothetical protein